MRKSVLLEVSEKIKTIGPLLPRKMGVLWVMLGLFAGSSVGALEAPKGPVVLQVSGLIEAHNQGKVAALDMRALQALPQKSFTTQTPWDQKPVSFSGPLLRDVLQLVKAKGQHIRAVALNDYRVKLPVSDAREHDVVVAVQMNGQAIPVRTKGPLFIVYPFDAKKELQHKTYYERSIWQLKAIEVE
ncbi:molybdopterin-dependent oxidoreductase [Limnohabitans sp. 63ED37-2]|uniref:molybdopterin-dependent oxidoreductase n=1 Tax=Limnohabitans sp. 63ED37-2 TaxID=1678128 RepID=UPI000706B60F|nr:molybdopterin-dependent oxidoreductase [Limnohabitans sp. 63ED37-2]ALK89719.1 Oxidoreductase molybdopterin binding domain protein [Limnohabitans sp. 63ED37-2]